MTELTGRLTKSGLHRVALWVCACNLFTVSLLSQQPPVDLTLANTTLTSGTYPATNSITAGPNLTVSGTVTFVAGGSIHLADGFHATTGSAFRAYIACVYSISPVSQSFPSAGGSGTVSVTAATGCPWTAVSNTPTWLHVTSGASGTGNGTVGYSVDTNTGSARNGTITVAGQTFTVTQAAPGGVQHTITSSPDGRSLTVDGVPCTAPCTFQWTAGTQHTIATTFRQLPYYFSYWSDSGALSHAITAEASPRTYTAYYFTDALEALRRCLDPATSTSSTCTLAEGTHTVASTINIERYGVTLSGEAAQRTATRLVRGPTLTEPLVRVAVPNNGATVTMIQAGKTQGVVIQNFTFCGGGNTHPNVRAGPPDYGNPAVMSPPGSPCGDQHMQAPSACNYTDHVCVDLSVDSLDSGYYPANQYSGPYALELNNVDLEDAAGHALSLYAAAGDPGATPPRPARKVNDIWIHDSAINYSAITGIVYGFNFVSYDDKFCDHYAEHNPYPFDYDPALVAPRNIRIEHNDFRYNNTGAMGGGAVRWVGLRYNNFYVNYISPQGGNFGGGGIELDACADQVEISYNTITGPNSSTGIPPSGYAPFGETGALELYGRNFNVHDNTIRGHGAGGIGAYSLYSLLGGTISQNHVLQDNGWYFTTGGIEVGTSFAPRPCDAVPRDTNVVTVTANDSNPIDVNNNNTPLPTGPATQAYGVYLKDHGNRSTGRLAGVTVSPDNFSGVYPLYHTNESVFLAPFVALYGYSGVPHGNTLSPGVENPRLLPVDVTDASSSPYTFSPLWPTPPRCSDRPNFWPAPGSKKGSSRAMFKFSASDRGSASSLNGASNIAAIWGIFSVGGNDTDGFGGPSAVPAAPDQGLCNFAYDAVNNLIYLGDGNGGWLAPSVIGPGGQDLSTPGGCVIHAATSTSWISLGRPQADPTAYVVDLTLDVSLPTSQANKYHIYSYTENLNYLFDACGSQSSNPPCPTWKYSGYWWNVQ